MAFSKHCQRVFIDGKNRINRFTVEYMKSGTFRMVESEATPVRFFGRNVELLLVNDIIFGRERQIVRESQSRLFN